MTHAHVTNGEVDRTGSLPTSGFVTVDSGRVGVSGFDQLPADVLAAEGWLPLVDEPPDYDPAREHRVHTGHTITAGQVTADYDVLPGPEPANADERRAAAVEVAGLLVADQIRAETLAPERLPKVAAAFPPWRPGDTVAVGDLRRYAGTVVECIQDHTTQADWAPDVTPALWKVHRVPGEAEPWVQPTGAHDAYAAGETVTHNSKTWSSNVDGNVWEPPEQWTEVTAEV